MTLPRRRFPLLLGLALAVLILASAPARAEMILSTLPQTNDDPLTSSGFLGPLRIKAIAFTMPSAPYTLDNIVLRIARDVEGRPFTAPILRLLNDSASGDNPGSTVLASFTAPAPTSGINNVPFTPTAGFTLQANTRYWMALSSADDFTTSGLTWFASNPGVTPTGVAQLSGNRFTSNGGVTWNASAFVNSFTINATVVPEPASIALAGIGLIAVVWAAIGRRRAG